MQFVRKLLAKLAKFIIKCAPKKWVESLKQNPRLVAAYSNNLHKSGLMYQLQTLEELERSYADYCVYQNAQIQKLLQNESKQTGELTLVICVVNFEATKLLATLESVKNQHSAFSHLIFWCNRSEQVQLADFLSVHLNQAYTLTINLNDDTKLTHIKNNPSFIIYAGDVLNYYAHFILSTQIQLATQLAYVDTDVLDGDNKKGFPDFKPNWNPDLQLTAGYVNTGLWVDDLGRITSDCINLNLFSVSTYLCESYLYNKNEIIQHISLVMVSCPQKKANLSDAKEQLKKMYHNFAEIIENNLPTVALRWHLKTNPLVSIIIPTRNSMDLVKECIESILNRTTYTHYEILLIDNGSDDAECIRYFKMLNEHPKITLLTYNKPFNYSAINNFGAKHAKGEVLALVNNDIEVISPDWLLDMVSHVMRNDIGCVGAKLLYGDNRIQHAGVVMGYGGGAGHGHKYFPGDHLGYMNRLIASQNYSAVTAACLLVTTDDFWAVGGLNEEYLAVAFNDVDLCLKVQQLGRRNLYCAEAVLYHHESVSRGHENTPEKVLRFNSELAYLQATWSEAIDADPAYNPNLTLRRENFSIKSFG
ncbi:glycosyltransferase family 2 protein [Pseudoalteromonas agarivorans]|uniref:glycosyltransferase family 2 protein n=1 Tax=Pseudoalteromonas agarivorans TaxID=176102 RepID=UPI00311E88C1